jgi:hypothetical protein
MPWIWKLENRKTSQKLLEDRGKPRKRVSIWPIAGPSECPPTCRQKEVRIPYRFAVLCRLFSRHLTQPQDSPSEHTKWRLSVDLKHLGGAVGEVGRPRSVLQGHTAPLDRGGDRYSLCWNWSYYGAVLYVTQVQFEDRPAFRRNLSPASVGFFLSLCVDIEDRGDKILPHVGLPPNYIALQPRIPQS